MLSQEQGKKLLRLAKDSISSYFSKRLEVDEAIKKQFSEKQGVFVTLYKKDELRGCIGYSEPVMPLWQAVVEAAQAAAFSDPRFTPIQKHELKDIRIEISILTKPVELKYTTKDDIIKQIKIGRDGLIIQNGLLLPQVAVEWGWDADHFLNHTCIKAGLPENEWAKLKLKIYKFQTQIFKQ